MPAMHVVLASALLAGAPVADVRVHVTAGAHRSLADSATDVARALSKVPGFTVVGSAGDADVLVQVVERRRARTGRFVPIPSSAGMLLLPVRERQVVAAVTTRPEGADLRADTLSGRHRRSWRGAAEDLVEQIRAWSRP